jgi:hypothetical protein
MGARNEGFSWGTRLAMRQKSPSQVSDFVNIELCTLHINNKHGKVNIMFGLLFYCSFAISKLIYFVCFDFLNSSVYNILVKHKIDFGFGSTAIKIIRNFTL